MSKDTIQQVTRKPNFFQKSAASLFPELITEWDFDENDCELKDLFPSTKYRAAWICAQCSNKWVATVGHRTAGQGCPVCGAARMGKARSQPKNVNVSVAGLYPHLLEEWSDEENNGKSLNSLKPGSDFRGKWTCKTCSHKWETMVKKRASGQGCPVCAQGVRAEALSRPRTVEESLAYLFPEIASQWDTKNNDVLPIDLFPKSGYYASWICPAGHSYKMIVQSRVNERGCPYCSGRFAILGVNDLKTLMPELSKEWDYEKNFDLRPEQVKISTHQKVWWKCAMKGHSWLTSVQVRASMNCGCPYCANNGMSNIEQQFRERLALLLTNMNSDARARTTVKSLDKRIQIDFTGEYLGRKVAIEYDGRRYHETEKALQRDTEKSLGILADGWILIRIRDRDLQFLKILDSNLLQLSHVYSKQVVNTDATIALIKTWLDSLTIG